MSEVAAKRSTTRFPCIDGLRAIAALAVVVYHTTIHYNILTLEQASWEWINRLGNFGVSSFFLISGFLLYRPYVLAHLRDEPEPQSGAFYKRRFFRIFPGYWLALGGALWLGRILPNDPHFFHFHGLNEFLTSFGLAGNYRSGYTLFGLGVEWTLVIEVSFYLALPLFAKAFRALSPRNASPRRKLRGHLAGLALIYVVAMLTRVWDLWLRGERHYMRGKVWFPIDQIDKWLISYLDWFALGMLLAVGSAWVATGGTLPWVGRELARRPWVCWLLALESYWVALQLHLPANIFETITNTQNFGIAFVYGLVGFLLLFPAVFGDQQEGSIRRFLQSRVMHALGTVSFGIYLWHLAVVKVIELRTKENHFPDNLFVWLLVVIPVTIALATISYFAIEKPLIRLSHRDLGVGRLRATERPAAPPAFGPARRELRAAAELFALSGIAIAQPLLDLLGKNTGLFVTRGTSGFQAILLALLIVVVPPLAAYFVEAAVAVVSARARAPVHALLCGLLVAIIAIEIFKRPTSLGSGALLLIAFVAGTAAAVLIGRWEQVRQFIRFLAIGPPIFVVLFVAFSPVTDVVFSNSTASAVSSVGITRPKRVVLVVMDEFPLTSLLDGTGHVDSALFPNFAALASSSNWYRNETTVAPYTELAVPAILSGQYPKRQDALPFVSDYPNTLFSLLGKGYSMNVHEAVTRLCPQRVCTGQSAGSGFGGLVSQSAKLWTEFASPNRTSFSFNESEGTQTALHTSQNFIRSLRRGGNRGLDFVHIELPHQPWHYLRTLQDSQATGPIQGAKYLEWSDQYSAAAARQRHLLQVQACDTLLGRIVAKLKALGAYDNSLVIVTADHGMSFRDRQPLRSTNYENYTDIMWTPLFVKLPGQTAGVIDDRPALSVDVLPTIADVLGVKKIPWAVDGRSLLGPARAEGVRPMFQFKTDAAFQLRSFLSVKPPQKFLPFDGAKGFAEVLRAHAVDVAGDPALRIYRLGAFGDLVGREAAPLVVDRPGKEVAAISGREDLAKAKPRAHFVPFAYGEGFVNDVGESVPVAIALDGRVVAVSYAKLLTGRNDGYFIYAIPPQLVRPGANKVSVYIIRGTTAAPSLDPVTMNQ